jgi:inhibitor of KinA sporulation pathway (predicted exonuclease)
MREHGGIINIECPLVKSMDEEEISRVASAKRTELSPRLLSYKYYFGEYSLTEKLVGHIMNDS